MPDIDPDRASDPLSSPEVVPGISPENLADLSPEVFAGLSTRLPPSSDVVFRRLFDETDGCRLLKSLLNALLGLTGDRRLSGLTLLRTQVSGDNAHEKEAVLDIRAQDQRGHQYNIEVQIGYQSFYRKRSAYYLCAMHGNQLEPGRHYKQIRPTIGIHFIHWELFKHTGFHSVFELRERTRQDKLTEPSQLELHYIELPRFERTLASLLALPTDSALAMEEKWLYFIKYGHEMSQAEVEAFGVSEICLAEERLMIISQDRQLRYEHQARYKAQMDRDSWAPDLIEEGRLIGKEEGHKEGHEEGHKEGHKEGRREEATRSLVLIWQARFGDLPPPLQTRLSTRPSLERIELALQEVAVAVNPIDALASVTAVLSADHTP